MDIIELQKKAFETANKRGKVNDDTRFIDYILALYEELGELQKAKKTGTKQAMNNYDELKFEIGDTKAYEHYIKNSKADELADLFITSLSLAESRKWSIKLTDIYKSNQDISYQVVALYNYVARLCKLKTENSLNDFIEQVKLTADNLCIDLEQAVKYKMLYNDRRGD